jgi:hypothetical protein
LAADDSPLRGGTVNHLVAVPPRAFLVSAATRADRRQHRLPGRHEFPSGHESDKKCSDVAELIVAAYRTPDSGCTAEADPEEERDVTGADGPEWQHGFVGPLSLSFSRAG